MKKTINEIGENIPGGNFLGGNFPSETFAVGSLKVEIFSGVFS